MRTAGRDAWSAPAAVHPPHAPHPSARPLGELRARSVFNVTELERFADCSSAWFFDRVIDPKTIDQEVDARLRGSVAHSALFRFFKGLPKELGTDHVVLERVEDAVRFMRSCLDQALAGVRVEMTELQRRELQQTLARDLERLVRAEAETELPLQPSRFEVAFGSERSVPELQRGLELGDGIVLSGEDRQDRRRPVQRPGDRPGLQVGQERAVRAGHRQGAAASDPALHARASRPGWGSSRSAACTARCRASWPCLLLRAEAKDDALPGFAKADYLKRGDVLEAGRGLERDRAAFRRPNQGGRRRPRSEGWRVPGLVRPLDDVPGEAGNGLDAEQ